MSADTGKGYYLLALVLAGLGGALLGFVGGMHYDGLKTALAQQTAVAKAGTKVQAKASADIKRATTTGTQVARQSQALDDFFTGLYSEQTHAPADPVDGCVLPAERLRRWTDANRWRADSSGATGQHDGTTATPAATPVGVDAGSRSESPAGDPAVSPAGDPVLRAAGVSGDQP